VYAALLEVGPIPGVERLAGEHDGDAAGRVARFEAPIGDPRYPVQVEIDWAARSLAMQGNWWYRGVYSVREHPRGSIVEHEVVNIATRGRWVVPLMQRRLPGQIRRDLAVVVQAIARRLAGAG
jgi:hypothetical protein